MKGKDSYPPADIGDSSSAIDISDLPEGGDEEKKKSSTVNGENEDARGSEKWDGSEAEIVVDDEAEEYEEETTGIKIKYMLKPEEIRNFIRHSKNYKESKKAQKKHAVIQSILFVTMITLGFLTGSIYYIWLSALPITALILMWLIPLFSVNRLIKDIFKSEELEVEIFPDKIEIKSKNQSREIPLDGSCESEEFEDMIMIFSKGSIKLIVPRRAVEPEFQADVEAMIFAGAKPRYKN